MAAKLQCEICGGKLIGKPGGVFECDSCGTEYSTEWAKAKIQEIQGTVKVEGTVEVQGKVQVEGPVKVEGAANKESLLKRGALALEDGKWKEAEKHFNEALNADAECAEAYIGLAMADVEAHNRNELVTNYAHVGTSRDANGFIAHARQFADSTLLALLDEVEANRKTVISALAAEREHVKRFKGLIACHDSNVYAVKTDGTVLTRYRSGEERDWKDIVAIAAPCSAGKLVIGLKSNGTVVASSDKIKVNDWSNIVAVASGHYYTVGLKDDGTVITECVYGGEQLARDWRDIVAVDTGYSHIVGLRKDRTVVTAGGNTHGCCEVDHWRDVVAISAGVFHTVGLKADGTVLAVGSNEQGKCNVSEWTDIVAVAAGDYQTMGLRADGTVVVTDKKGWHYISGWKNIISIDAGKIYAGLQTDGTIVLSGGVDDYVLRDVSKWKLFNSAETLEQERKEAAARMVRERIEAFERAEKERQEAAAKAEAERQECVAALQSEQNALQTELVNLKGLFSGKRRKEIETRLAEIDAELKKLQ